jgi:PAS domain S-box-containing protein
MTQSDKATHEKGLLKKLRVLYVEDDDSIRTELSSLLNNFFDIVYIAKDGQEGYDIFVSHQDKIDVILSDINMPRLTGIEMMKEIRKIDTKVPLIFATAYSDNSFLTEAIKLKVYDYIIKPINIRNLLTIFNELAYKIYQDFLIQKQNLDLERYKEVIDANNIVLHMDLNGNITYANESFCDTSGYIQSEVQTLNLSNITHKENINLVNEMLISIKEGKHWKGNIKCLTKFDDEYIVETYAIPSTTKDNQILGAMIVQKDITAQINQKREIQSALMKAKSKVFLEGKETIAELNAIINEQSKQINELSSYLKQSEVEKMKLLNLQNRHQMEVKILTNELIELRNQPKPTDYQTASLLKLNKENLTLKSEIRKLETEKAKLTKDLEKDIFREKITLEVMVDDLEHELASCREQLEMFKDKDVLEETILSYQQKAKNDEKKAKLLEAKILRICDKETAKLIFTDDRKEDRDEE